MQNYEISEEDIKREKLTTKKVTIVDITEQTPNNKTGTEIKPKFVFMCKHPDKEELIEISKVKYEKDKKLTIAGTWVSLDENNKLLKNCATSILLTKIGAKKIQDAIKKEVETTEDDNGYLVFKAY